MWVSIVNPAKLSGLVTIILRGFWCRVKKRRRQQVALSAFWSYPSFPRSARSAWERPALTLCILWRKTELTRRLVANQTLIARRKNRLSFGSVECLISGVADPSFDRAPRGV